MECMELVINRLIYWASFHFFYICGMYLYMVLLDVDAELEELLDIVNYPTNDMLYHKRLRALE